MPTKEQITEALRPVIDPELRRSIVDLGMVRSIEIREGGKVEVVVSLTTAGCPIRGHFQQAVAKQVSELDGVNEVAVGFDVLSDGEKQNLQKVLGRAAGLPEGALAAVGNVICVASGKGGVGKSTMTANLAAALAAEGHSAGALDADVYGYSIPRMLGVNHKRPEVNDRRKIVPLDRRRRRQDDVDRILRRGERRRRLARADAPQGDPAVPRGRRLGRARLPAARPAAGHRRRLDDPFAAPSAGQVPAGDHAAARRAAGRHARRRDGGQVRPRDPRGDREHVRLHHARRPALHDLRRGRRPAPRRRARRTPARQGAAAGRAPRPGRRRRAARAHQPRRPGLTGDPRRRARDRRAARRRSCR